MLIRENNIYRTGMVIVMTDIAILTASAKNTLVEISKQASGLAAGLQNAAPGDKTNMPNKSVQYLYGTSEQLAKIAAVCEKLLMTNSHPSNKPEI